MEVLSRPNNWVFKASKESPAKQSSKSSKDSSSSSTDLVNCTGDFNAHNLSADCNHIIGSLIVDQELTEAELKKVSEIVAITGILAIFVSLDCFLFLFRSCLSSFR